MEQLRPYEPSEGERIRAALIAAAPELAKRAQTPTRFVCDMRSALAAIARNWPPTPTLRVEAGASTLEQEAIELGPDWEEILEQKKRELEALLDAGVPMPAWLNLGARKPPDEPPAEPQPEPAAPAGPKGDGGADTSWNPAIRDRAA